MSIVTMQDDFARFEHEGWQRVADKYDSVWSPLTRQFIPSLLAEAGVSLDDPQAAADYLSPVLCSSSDDQRKVREILEQWLHRKEDYGPDPGSSPSSQSSARKRSGRSSKLSRSDPPTSPRDIARWLPP